MKEGLEGVVEFLLPELAFAGEKGLSVDVFLALTKQYFREEKRAQQGSSQSNAAASTSGTASVTLDTSELAFARGAWTWLVARPNVLVGGSRRLNKLSLDDVLALPEPVAPTDATATPASGGTPAPSATPAPQNAPIPGNTPAPPSTPGPDPASPQVATPARKQRPTNAKVTLTTRPRIHVTEETVWKAITGHGVDYKQIPRLEWHLLQGIAAAKHEGILQGDVRRLVGQDKRSVPKRTDFLAAKGYIVKRSIMVRKSKTSKLWLAGFAPTIGGEGGEGSQAKDVKMTKEVLTRDLSPVPWHAKWTGADIDVETFAESILAIAKAWGVMRYSDVRLKMGVEELRWQMRVMARLTRSLVDMGLIKYTAATFANSRKVWKDCIKFIRDPTEAEWTKILATGKKTSKYTDLSKDRQPKPFALALADKTTPQPQGTPAKGKAEGADGGTPAQPTTSGLSGWVAEKPLQQTLFEAVDAAGPDGATNPQISAGTVGYNFRRYCGTMLTNMSMCKQPPHLDKFQLHRKLVRVDKTSAFIYTTNQANAAPVEEGAPAIEAPAPAKTSMYGFRSVQRDKLADPSASLSEISRKLRGRKRQHAPLKDPLAAEAPGANEDTRLPKRRRVGRAGDALGPVKTLAGKPPGVYVGEPGSINPNPKRTGRPKRSLVVIFKLDVLKDANFWKNGSPRTCNPDQTVVGVQYNGIPGKLCLNRTDKTLVFSRKPQPPGKEPLTIQLDDLLGEPVIRPVPGCDDNSLVFVTKATSQNPSWTFVFLFKDDATSQERVAEIQKRVKSIMKGGPAHEDSPPQAPQTQADINAPAGPPGPVVTPQAAMPTEPGQAAEDTTVSEAPTAAPAAASTPPWKVKGPGKGRTKKGASASGQRPWKCEKCGNSWKNDIGLKYHLTKAQVPCNPDFVAAPPVPAGSKRKRAPTVPAGESANDGESVDRPTTRQRGNKPQKRRQVKLEHGGTPTFRGLTVDRSYLDRDAEPVARTAVAASPAKLDEVHRPVMHTAASQSLTPQDQGDLTSLTVDVPMAESGSADDDLVLHHDTATHGRAPSALPVQANDTARPVSPRHETVSLVQGDTPALADTSMPDVSPLRHQVQAASDKSTTAISPTKASETSTLPKPAARVIRPPESPRRPAIQSEGLDTQPRALVTQNKLEEGTTVPDAASTSVKATETPKRRPLPDNPKRRPLPDKPTKRQQDPSETGPAPFRPNHYAHLSTDSKIRTAQALDIVEYLLQNNGGIFPGDKALFYAMLRIYLKAFSGQMPPSLNNLRVACRRLTSKGKAREIVHAFRTSTGKIITSSMLLATEIDPNGLVPTVVKRKIQEAYPGVFIPPAFSPSKEELKLLEEFDREPAESEAAEATPKPAGKFRGRRDNLEVEIMQAPYYKENPQEVGGQHQTAAGGKTLHAAASAVDEAAKKRRKRSAGDPATSRSAKKQKTLGSKLLGVTAPRKKDGESVQDSVLDASDDDMGQAEPPSSEPEDAPLESATLDSTPIASAIKAYGLLPPPRTGPKKRRPVDGLVKLAREEGRAKNPGLTSLPHFFFTNRYHDFWSQNTHSTHLTFLEPNTRLDDYHVTSWFEDLGDSAILFDDDDSSSIATEEEEMSPAEQPEAEGVVAFSFVPSVAIKEYSRGSWPKTPPNNVWGQSVQMQGWTPSLQETLADLLPADVNEMSSWNKRRRLRLDLYVDPLFAEFSELIDRCQGWEESEKGAEVMTVGTLAPDYRFINASPVASVCQMRPVAPVWDEKNDFTLDTFPYALATVLAEDEDEEPLFKKPRLDLLGRKPKGRPPTKKESPKKDRTANAQEPKEKKRVGRKPKRIRLPALEAEREHTAYPQSAEEYMDIHHGAERTPEWNSEHTQLAAFVCVTTLLGGVSKSVDWGIMMRLFPDMSLSHLRKFFGEMNKDRKSTIIDLTQKFQKAFLEAYEKGDLPPLDYDNVLAYDWKALTLWTRGLAGDESTLPPSYAELEKRDMVVSDRAHQPRDWRETFWLPARSLYNRYQDSSSQAFAMAIDQQPMIEDEDDDNLRVAMSWVRALCITSPNPPAVVSAKWETFKGLPRATISDLIDKSIRTLQEKLVITKDKNLIVMRLNDRVVKALDKAAQDQKFAEAARFKRRLDKAFRKGKARYRIPYTADDDGLTMALLNLQAHGRVTIQTDNKHVPLGYEPFNYETRKFDRKYHHFSMWAVPTDRYLYSKIPEDYDGEEDDTLAVLLSNMQATPPPLEGKQGELPLWVDFFGKVDEARWRKCLGAVLFILSTRGPMRAAAIADQLKCFVAFEVELVLDWADGLGLLEQMTPSAPKCVTEWWWLAVEAQRKRAEGETTRTAKKGKGPAKDAAAIDVDRTAGSAAATSRT